MPKYQYRCADCGVELEVFQKFTDDAMTVCPECKGNLRKVFNAVGVVFKGSGFYKTDNRSSGTSSAPKKDSAPAKTEAAPAKAPAAASAE